MHKSRHSDHTSKFNGFVLLTTYVQSISAQIIPIALNPKLVTSLQLSNSLTAYSLVREVRYDRAASGPAVVGKVSGIWGISLLKQFV